MTILIISGSSHSLLPIAFFVESHLRLNTELDLLSLFGLHVHSCTEWLRPCNPPPPTRIWLKYEGALGQPRKTTSLCDQLPKMNRLITMCPSNTKPVFVNFLRSPGIDSQPGVPVRQPYLMYRPARQAESVPWNRFLGSLNVYKFGL